MFINYNGKIIPADQPLFGAENRAFRYGDGLFETIRMFNGQLPFWKTHWERLMAGIAYLQFQKVEQESFYKNEIRKLCGSKGNWRIRLSLFRKNGGKYTPLDSRTDFLIEVTPMDGDQFELNGEGINLELCETIDIPRHPLSNFKTINSLPYVIAGIYKATNQLDDCILLNDKGRVVEASSSNIFILKNDKLITPPLSSGCKDGTMRKVIIQVAQELGIAVLTKPFKPKSLLKAEEIWLTNAIRGIVWAKRFQENQLSNLTAKKMLLVLNEKIDIK